MTKIVVYRIQRVSPHSDDIKYTAIQSVQDLIDTVESMASATLSDYGKLTLRASFEDENDIVTHRDYFKEGTEPKGIFDNARVSFDIEESKPYLNKTILKVSSYQVHSNGLDRALIVASTKEEFIDRIEKHVGGSLTTQGYNTVSDAWNFRVNRHLSSISFSDPSKTNVLTIDYIQTDDIVTNKGQN